MREAAMFTNLIVSRRRQAGVSRRLAAFGLAASLYVVLAAALILTPLLVVESVDPPKAVYDPIPVFRVISPAGGALDSMGRPHGGGDAGRRAPPAHPPAPLPRPPKSRPVVVPLAPPSSEAPEAALPGSEAPGPYGAGEWGNGDGPGPGDGRGGRGCEGCTGDTPGGGPGNGDEAILDEQDPRIVPPVVILSTRALPKYPDLARRAKVEGTVILLIVIDRDGRVGEVQVLRTPDLRYGFDLAAIEAVKQWRYRPALLGGRPVAVQASVMVEFAISR